MIRTRLFFCFSFILFIFLFLSSLVSPMDHRKTSGSTDDIEVKSDGVGEENAKDEVE